MRLGDDNDDGIPNLEGGFDKASRAIQKSCIVAIERNLMATFTLDFLKWKRRDDFTEARSPDDVIFHGTIETLANQTRADELFALKNGFNSWQKVSLGIGFEDVTLYTCA